MSPVNDDVVFFTVLAAGLVPVVAPLDPQSGNIDAGAVDDETWETLDAVLTTNLYGIPDRMDLLEARSRRHDLLLLEDACHALDSRFDGQRIGTFGEAAVYSLSKHLGLPGGILVFREAERRESLVRNAKAVLRTGLLTPTTAYTVAATLRAEGAPRRVLRRIASVLDRVAPDPRTRRGHRMPYRVEEVRRAQAAGGGLDRFDPWVRMDNLAYRTWPPRAVREASLRRLEAFDEERRRRLEGARTLRKLGCTPHTVRLPFDTALLRVPLFFQDREVVIAYLARRGIPTEYVYDPPLDVYAAGLADILPSAADARIWSRDVLPVNPLIADQVLDVLRTWPGRDVPIAETA